MTGLGLKRGTAAVEPHRHEWETAAQEMVNKLKAILKEDAIDVQHIGSTAIRNICAKPIIDVAVGVTSFDKMMRHNDELLEEGIVYRREDYPGQHLYVCGDFERNIQTHFIHVVIWGQKAWNNYISMRDYLNANENKAKEYSALKEQLAKIYPDDRTAYTKGKAAFIESILRNACQSYVSGSVPVKKAQTGKEEV